MLLTDLRVNYWNVANSIIFTHQVCTLPVHVKYFQLFFAFERVQPPLFLGHCCLRRLVVLDDDAFVSVGVSCQVAAQSQVRLFFLHRLLLFFYSLFEFISSTTISVILVPLVLSI